MSQKVGIYVKDQNRVNQVLAGDSTGRMGMSYVFSDITSTGRANLTLAQEATIISGVAGKFLDLIMVSGANTSGNAQTVDIRFGTAGAIVDTITIPSGNSFYKSYEIPLPMSEVAQAITAKNSTAGEISDSSVTITILAVQR